MKTKEELMTEVENWEHEDKYADYIIAHATDHDRYICNGDMLILAMEDGFLMEEFVDFLFNQQGK